MTVCLASLLLGLVCCVLLLPRIRGGWQVLVREIGDFMRGGGVACGPLGLRVRRCRRDECRVCGVHRIVRRSCAWATACRAGCGCTLVLWRQQRRGRRRILWRERVLVPVHVGKGVAEHGRGRRCTRRHLLRLRGRSQLRRVRWQLGSLSLPSAWWRRRLAAVRMHHVVNCRRRLLLWPWLPFRGQRSIQRRRLDSRVRSERNPRCCTLLLGAACRRRRISRRRSRRRISGPHRVLYGGSTGRGTAPRRAWFRLLCLQRLTVSRRMLLLLAPLSHAR